MAFAGERSCEVRLVTKDDDDPPPTQHQQIVVKLRLGIQFIAPANIRISLRHLSSLFFFIFLLLLSVTPGWKQLQICFWAGVGGFVLALL